MSNKEFALLVSFGVASALPAQEIKAPPAMKADIRPGAVDAQLVKTGLYLISGGGSNSLLRLNGVGLIVVNGKLPGNYDAMRAQIKRICKMSEVPVAVVILTDHYREHTGTNADFHAAGVAIAAHENVNKLMLEAGETAGSLPTVTFKDDHTIRMGGAEARLLHFDAHAGGDTVVYFPNLKTIAVGELLGARVPIPDYRAGGSLRGWSAALDAILKLDFDTVVPGNGPLATRQDVQSFKTSLDDLSARGSQLARTGTPKELLAARLFDAKLGSKVQLADDQLDSLFAELASMSEARAVSGAASSR